MTDASTAPVRVHIATHLPEASLDRIRQVSPRIELTYRPYSPYEPPAALDELVGDVEVLLSYHAGFPLARAPRLRWLQLSGDGVNHLAGKPILASDVTITNARLFAVPIAEYVFASVLGFFHHFPRIRERFQQAREWPRNQWEEYPSVELEGKTLAVVGHGSIGRRVAHLARAFGMSVVATRRTANRVTVEDGVEVHPAGDLLAVLARADVAVVSLPLTPGTAGLIGESALRALPRGAYLVSVGRGGVIDEAALLRALREGWIAGAGIDVWAETPLPPTSPFFDLPNVVMTPHCSGHSEGYPARMTDLFCDNLRRYLTGAPLRNLVDKTEGY